MRSNVQIQINFYIVFHPKFYILTTHLTYNFNYLYFFSKKMLPVSEFWVFSCLSYILIY